MRLPRLLVVDREAIYIAYTIFDREAIYIAYTILLVTWPFWRGLAFPEISIYKLHKTYRVLQHITTNLFETPQISYPLIHEEMRLSQSEAREWGQAEVKGHVEFMLIIHTGHFYLGL